MFAASKSAKAAVAAATTDPSFPYVPLLLEPTSTNGQQNNTFLDSSTNNFTITRNGTPTQGSVTPYWTAGQWSNNFNLSTDKLTLAGPNLSGLTNFTFECWVNFTAFGTDSKYFLAISGSTYYQLVHDSSTGISLRVSPSYTKVVGETTNSGWSVGVWYHVALVKNGNDYTIYKNGVSIATATYSTALPSVAIGNIGGYDATTGINAYMSNFRITNTAVYTTTFTPPTSPLTAISGTLILTCQSNRFVDNSASPYALTVNGTPKVQAFQPFSPTASYTTAAYVGSGYFNGSTDYLSAASNAAFAFGTGDLTIEFWVYVANTTNNMSFVDMRNGTTIAIGPLIYMTSSGTVIYFVNNVSQITSSAISANAWTHIAVSRSSTSTKMFINGVQAGSTYSDSNNYIQSSVFVGRYSDSASGYLNGYISNLRLVKGTAVYTAAFTLPTSPLTAITNTSLLLNYTNAGIYDAAVQNNVITVGDAQASTTQSKWSPTSIKFDGTGDWLTAIDSPQLQLGSGDFTIDGWFYLSATGAIYGMVSKGTATTGWSVNVTVLNKLQFSYTTSNLTGATTLSASTWYYFAVVRSGSATGNLKLYLNGTADATSGGAVTDNFNQTSILYVGADRVGATPLNGYLQDVRITKLARTITTPTAAFPTR